MKFPILHLCSDGSGRGLDRGVGLMTDEARPARAEVEQALGYHFENPALVQKKYKKDPKTGTGAGRDAVGTTEMTDAVIRRIEDPARSRVPRPL